MSILIQPGVFRSSLAEAEVVGFNCCIIFSREALASWSLRAASESGFCSKKSSIFWMSSLTRAWTFTIGEEVPVADDVTGPFELVDMVDDDVVVIKDVIPDVVNFVVVVGVGALGSLFSKTSLSFSTKVS